MEERSRVTAKEGNQRESGFLGESVRGGGGAKRGGRDKARHNTVS